MAPVDAPAEPKPYHSPITAVIMPGKTPVTKAKLVGRSGEVFSPQAGGKQWVRTTAGGVATTVKLAIPTSQGLIVGGMSTPLFSRQQSGVWNIDYLRNRGRISPGGNNSRMFTVGRHVYQLIGNQYKRHYSLPRTVYSFWAGSPRNWLATLKDQRIYYFWGRGIRQLTIPGYQGSKAKTLRKIRLYGDGKTIYLYAWPEGKERQLFRVRRFQINEVADLPDVTPLDVLGGRLLVQKGNALFLTTNVKSKLLLGDRLLTLRDGETVTVARADASGGIVLGLSTGRVLVRADKASAFNAVELVSELPKPQTFPEKQPARQP